MEGGSRRDGRNSRRGTRKEGVIEKGEGEGEGGRRKEERMRRREREGESWRRKRGGGEIVRE